MKFVAFLTALVVFMSLPATAERYTASLCVSRDGPFQIVTPDHPIPAWDSCDLKLPVTRRGFNTPGLTLVRSAQYNPVRRAFEMGRPTAQTEQLVVGEDLLVFDYTEGDLALAYVVSTRRMVFARLHDPQTQLLSYGAFQRLVAEHGTFLAIVAVANTTTYRSTRKVTQGSMPRGRVVVVEDDGRSDTGESMSKVRCISQDQTCPRRATWVDSKNIQTLAASPIPAGPLPAVKVGPVGIKLKQCRVEQTLSSAREFETIIEADLKLPKLLELQLKQSWAHKQTDGREVTYPETTEIRGTPFIVTGFTQGRHSKNRSSRPAWVADEASAVLLQTIEINCATQDALFQFEMVTPDGVFDAGPFSASLQFANSLEQKAFVDTLKSRQVQSLPDWLIGFIAAELSKR